MDEKQNSQSLIAWLLGQTGHHKRQYLLSVIYAGVGVAFSLAPYFVIVEIVHDLMEGKRIFQTYLLRGGWIAAFWLGRVLCHALSTATSHRATFTVLAELRKRCMEKLTRMPLGAVLEYGSGALKNTLIERIDSIETTLAHIVPEVTANLLVPLFILGYIFSLNWRMGFASLATLPIGMGCFSFMMVGSGPFYQRTLEATKALNATAVEYINGIQVIKVFGTTKRSYERFVRDAYEAAHSYIDWMRSCLVPFTLAMVVMPATMVFILPIGGLLVKGGSLSAEDFVTIMILSVGLITPIITLMSYSDDFRKMGTILGEVQGLLNAPEMRRPPTGQVPTNNTLELQDVHFAYQEEEVLHGISMVIPEGSFVALVGPSGSGKSTLARLMVSLWEVTRGKILLGNVDIRDIPLDAYADKVAFVSQDNYLFNQTVRENIRMGRPHATDAEVEEVAKQSGCHPFIMELEKGYETVVGSSGSHLSGGERQRIAIARAMLKDAPIIILDEATAYTDPENEAVIQRSLSRLTQGKTRIVIAHRLSTVTAADCIYVIEKGRIKESGIHDELLAQHGLYEKMWTAHREVKDHD